MPSADGRERAASNLFVLAGRNSIQQLSWLTETGNLFEDEDEDEYEH